MLKEGAEMQTARIWVFLALLPLLSGCFPVLFSEQPLGEPVVLDPKGWSGEWLLVEGQDYAKATISVVDADTIVLSIGDCDPQLGLSVREHDLRFQLRRYEHWYIIGETTAWEEVPLYRTGFLLHQRGSILEWFAPNEERVKALIEQGALPGRIENDLAVLGTLTPEHYTLLFGPGKLGKYPKAAKDDVPYNPFEPRLTMIKLRGELDACNVVDAAK